MCVSCAWQEASSLQSTERDHVARQPAEPPTEVQCNVVKCLLDLVDR